MFFDCKSCHGQFDCLQTGSTSRLTNGPFKIYQKFRSYVVWYFENLGVWQTFGYILTGRIPSRANGRGYQRTSVEKEKPSQSFEVLGLEPGELVEVRTIGEILATLGPGRKCKGLLWMTGMRKFCGKRYRVFKRVENILLETNGDSRKMTNTVILEGVMCDGAEFGNCDRSCFHFWREAWLKRIEED
jgi:hypothetical protein